MSLLRRWLLLRPAGPAVPLPQRVHHELAQAQFQAELLVTAVQLMLVVLLATLYSATPRGFSPGAPVEAVPLGLWLFTILALL
ncbi:MAG TPA: hypothetical protein VLJ19_07435, partial [Variovorax sp.]|nr:hypothetical protein [Variovorax sp.]